MYISPFIVKKTWKPCIFFHFMSLHILYKNYNNGKKNEKKNSKSNMKGIEVVDFC